MRLSEVQGTMDRYFRGNNVTVLLMQFSNILALIYPIYLILTRFNFLDFITGIFGTVSIIFYFAYFIGLILCFAKNDMLTVTIAFGLKAALEIIDLFVFSIGINSILSIVAYIAITIASFNYYKSNSNF